MSPNFYRVIAIAAIFRTLNPSCATLTETESIFMGVPSPQSARESLKFITSKPHVAGTPGDYEMAEFVRDKMLAAGIPSVEIQPVDSFLNYPVDRALRLHDADTGKFLFEAPLAEAILEEDPTSDTWWRNHTFNGYSPSGTVNAPYVYANYGLPQDLDALEEMGVFVEGKIVITRYGECFRGLKAMNAERRGAMGLIIYSDPQQDGFGKGPTYPEGGWRPPSGVQRGSVQFNSLCVGDPARAASGSESVESLCGYSKDDLVPSIPVLSISYGDAEPLLRALGGPVAPEGFQGGLDMEYTVGPSSTTVLHLYVKNREVVGPIWNVVGVIPGTLSEQTQKQGSVSSDTSWLLGKDRPVVLGNHRDAWVFGAVDPNSGTAALIEVANGLGTLLQEGWNPPRTVVLCSWSGEEYGMLGSTAWGEANAKGILANAIAYLNVDSAVSGSFLNVGATPSLRSLVEQALRDVRHPNSELSLAEFWSGDLVTLGSGSDYTVFLDHLGIASVNFEFRADATDEYGVYHSVFDSFAWMETQGDPDFLYHQAAAQLWGLLALRLADPHPPSHNSEDQGVNGTGLDRSSGSSVSVLPFDPVAQAEALEEYVSDLEALIVGPRLEGRKSRKYQDQSRREEGLSPEDLAPLKEAVKAFRTAAEGVALEVAAVGRRPLGKSAELVARGIVESLSVERPEDRDHPRGRGGLTRAMLQVKGAEVGMEQAARDVVEDLNDRLALTERRFLSEAGLPERKWFRHVLQAPGLYLGYDANTFPGVTQAISDRKWDLAQEQIKVAAACCTAAADFLSGRAGE
ncbi:unnamed protein product [Choristocarpus tenellus]